MIDPSIRDDGPAMSDKLLRQFAALWLIVFGILAARAAFDPLHTGRAVWLAVLSITVAVPGLIRPRTIEWLFRAAMRVATPIGWVVSHVLLGVIFYVLFTPLGLLFRVIRRDALMRRADANAKSLWIARRQSTDPRSYLHQ